MFVKFQDVKKVRRHPVRVFLLSAPCVFPNAEDELQGYQSDGYIGSDRKINDGTVTKSLVVKNWTDSPPPPPPPTPEPEYGSLKVTKTVAGDRLVADPDLGYIPATSPLP